MPQTSKHQGPLCEFQKQLLPDFPLHRSGKDSSTILQLTFVVSLATKVGIFTEVPRTAERQDGTSASMPTSECRAWTSRKRRVKIPVGSGAIFRGSSLGLLSNGCNKVPNIMVQIIPWIMN